VTKLQNQPSEPDIESVSRDHVEKLLQRGRLSEDDIINLNKRLRWFDSRDRKKEQKPILTVGIIGVILMAITLIATFVSIYISLQ